MWGIKGASPRAYPPPAPPFQGGEKVTPYRLRQSGTTPPVRPEPVEGQARCLGFDKLSPNGGGLALAAHSRRREIKPYRVG